jgi:hypothetical protein
MQYFGFFLAGGKLSTMAEEGDVLTEEPENQERNEVAGPSSVGLKAEVFDISFGNDSSKPNLQEAFMKYRSKRQVSACKQNHVAPIVIKVCPFAKVLCYQCVCIFRISFTLYI